VREAFPCLASNLPTLVSLLTVSTQGVRLNLPLKGKRNGMLKDLSGVGSLQDSLAKTNALLADVLAELKETNSERLEAIATALHVLNSNLEQSSPTKE
jgi:hypothetical protein